MLPADKHVIRVTPSGALRCYVSYAEGLLSDGSAGRVQIVAAGKAIGSAIAVAEILKRKRDDVHQVTELSRAEAPPGQYGDPVISILLAVDMQFVDTQHPGYVAPGSA